MKQLLAVLTLSMFAVSGAFAASHMKASDDKKADSKMEKKADAKMDKKDDKKAAGKDEKKAEKK